MQPNIRSCVSVLQSLVAPFEKSLNFMKSVIVLATKSVNSAPFERGRTFN